MASTFPHLFLFLLLTTLAAICLFSDISSAALDGSPSPRVTGARGGWRKVDPKSQDVVENGKYAIAEHNKEAKTKLQFSNVMEALEQSVEGTNYKLVVKALDGSSSDLYEAIVWVRPWLKFKQLTSFKKLLKSD